MAVEIRQDLHGSNALRPLDADRAGADGGGGGDGGPRPILTGTLQGSPGLRAPVLPRGCTPACLPTAAVPAALPVQPRT